MSKHQSKINYSPYGMGQSRYRCSICGKMYLCNGEPRLDARPFNNGKICCKSCFENIVIPYRNYIQDKMEMEEIDKWISENND